MDIPGYHPRTPSRKPPPPEDPEDFVPPPPGTFVDSTASQLPPGFIPLTIPSQPNTRSNTPVRPPSNPPIFVPPPSNPVLIPPPGHPVPSRSTSNTPVPIPPPPSNPLPVPPKESRSAPYSNPLPTLYEEVLPVPHRASGGSPRPARYDEAPIPAGVVYPEPGSSRTRATLSPESSTSSLRQWAKKSKRSTRADVRSPASGRLSPLAFPAELGFLTSVKSDTNASES